MKNTLLLISLFCSTLLAAQNLKPLWEVQTSGRVLAGPLIVDGDVFIGDENGTFYCLDIETGEEQWKVETNGNIQAKALQVNDAVFFESANVFYLLDRKTGRQRWKFDSGMDPFIFKYQEHEWPYKIDPFDDKRSVGTLHEGLIYVGSGNGSLYGIDARDGSIVSQFNAIDHAPIRSSPLIANGSLYFGDWEGWVYRYSLENQELLWKKKTYRGGKPYGTFGGVVSEFLIYDSLLFFGARNYMLNVLDIGSGEKDWTYTDPRKGWIIGDPVIFNDTLYIGGSDNYSMLAFDPKIGRKIWAQDGGKNIYTKPIVSEDWVIYTAGNGYNGNDTGVLFLLDRKKGDVIDQMELPKGSFSSPALLGNQLVFGCYDEKVRAVRIE